MLAGTHPGWASAVIVNLGDLGGGKLSFNGNVVNGSFASYINDRGDVAGYAYVNGTDYHAIYYSGITVPGTYVQGGIYDIGTFGGNNSQPQGLNQNGLVSGTSYALSGTNNVPQAFLYSGGISTNLGTLGGTNSFGYGVNSSGTVVGGSYIDNQGNQHAFSTTCSAAPCPTPKDLGGGSFAQAILIDDAGQIAGNTGSKAFFSQDGTSMNFISLASNTSAQVTGMNESGQVVGFSGAPSGLNHGFLYTPGTNAIVTDVGTLNSYNGTSFANAINEAGVVVGQSDYTFGQHHAFSCAMANGVCVMTDLGTLSGFVDSTATAINDLGQIVGNATALDGTTDPFLWIDGQMIDLNSVLPAGSDFTRLLTATGINNSGVIIGEGLTTNCSPICKSEAYVLTISAFQVPEPSTITLMALAFVGGAMAAIRRRRKDGRYTKPVRIE
jgi:probable HAF family extracellular repeat protein